MYHTDFLKVQLLNNYAPCHRIPTHHTKLLVVAHKLLTSFSPVFFLFSKKHLIISIHEIPPGMNLPFSPVHKCPPEISSHCQWMFYFIHFEMLAMVIEIPSFLLVIYATIKSPFHYNLTFIGLFMLSGYYVFLVGRFITCLYEIGVVTLTGMTSVKRKYIYLFYYYFR